jgi:spore germination cell wall hydrolase CwlJ-like protein
VTSSVSLPRLITAGAGALLCAALAWPHAAIAGGTAGPEGLEIAFPGPQPSQAGGGPGQSTRPRRSAAELNAAQPMTRLPVIASKPFVLEGPPSERERAVHCLTAAIHYEAASESQAGMEAVAQVVLNRVRHRDYPKSVCGVVFQGSERRTGCQFTFTCDGSLMRPASAAAWTRARAVAEQALNGAVMPAVGAALNYHAVYVRPRWSPALDKVARIGAHIFYRRPGQIDPDRSLTAAYRGGETLIVKAAAVRPAAGADRAPLAQTSSTSVSRAEIAEAAAAPPAKPGVFTAWGLEVAAVEGR